jgi:nitric oxide dioxygenase
MITDVQKELVKGTVPFLKARGVELTKHFYNRMFTLNPELKNVFNMGNQKNVKQQVALATAVLAYAEHIENPGVLLPVLDTIGQKHVSVGIRAEHYIIVGEHLLASIGEILGDAANEELMDAWSVAYFQLADLMSGHEASLYRDRISKKGGWTGWRPFKVDKKIVESAEITSFYLRPTDRGPIADFIPGQFISVRLFIPELDLLQPRQYSLSTSPNGKYYRISVKKEEKPEPDLNGVISNRLHSHLDVGDIIDVSAPSGTFVLRENSSPIVFISGGVGQTPLVSMMESLLAKESKKDMVWIHGCRGYDVHAFRMAHESWGKEYENVKRHVFYGEVNEKSAGIDCHQGWVDLEKVRHDLSSEADYYICGPKPFIEKHFKDLTALGIDRASIFYEEFGPQTLNLN